MQRSNTISNFLESKTKKKWSNPFSSKSSKDSLTRDSRSSSVSSISSYNAAGAIPRSQSTLRVGSTSSSSTSSADVKRRNRSSLMVPPSTASKDVQSTTQKHKSYIGFGSLRVDTSTVTDPKELEFYKQLLSSSKSAGTITEENEEDEDVEDDCSFSVSHASDEMCSTATPTTAISSREGTPEKSSMPETLTSALEDYQLFTKRNTLIITPTTPIFPSKTSDEVDEECRLSSSNSVPSLASLDSIDSAMSVMKVSNSLWVGFTDDEKLMKYDALDGFDADGVFNDVEELNVVRFTERTSHRTSLIFV